MGILFFSRINIPSVLFSLAEKLVHSYTSQELFVEGQKDGMQLV